MLQAAGVSERAAAEGIAGCQGVPGRMEAVDEGQDFLALVDYAHTPDALAAVLSSLRPDAARRLILVVGCGGDRDPTKREPMGSVAAERADVLIVTDDNPRSEDPVAIRAAMVAGAEAVDPSTRAVVLDIGGRAAAIRRAVALAGKGDIVLVAGKGHETGQEIAGQVEPFDDRSVLVDTLRDRRTMTGVSNPAAAKPEDHLRLEEER